MFCVCYVLAAFIDIIKNHFFQYIHLARLILILVTSYFQDLSYLPNIKFQKIYKKLQATSFYSCWYLRFRRSYSRNSIISLTAILNGRQLYITDRICLHFSVKKTSKANKSTITFTVLNSFIYLSTFIIINLINSVTNCLSGF